MELDSKRLNLNQLENRAKALILDSDSKVVGLVR